MPGASDMHQTRPAVKSSTVYSSAWRAASMAENRATFSLRRRRSLGFSNCRRPRTTLSVPSRSTFFFSRRNARSTGSPFFSLISVNALTSFPGAGQITVLPRFPPKMGNSGWTFCAGSQLLKLGGKIVGRKPMPPQVLIDEHHLTPTLSPICQWRRGRKRSRHRAGNGMPPGVM